MNRLATRVILMGILVTLTLSTAFAHYLPDDAGKDGDAGDAKATATALGSFGTYYGFLTPRDADWYRVDAASAAPACVQVDVRGAEDDTVRLTLDSADRSRSVGGALAGGERTLALAVPSFRAAYFDVLAAARYSAYEFAMGATGIPAASAGDALTGGDASSSLDQAAPVPGACFGGHIDPVGTLGDIRDVYRFQASAGQTVTYGFAAAGDPGVLNLMVLDAQGRAVGPSLSSGQFASVVLPASGTYYLSASRATVGTEDLGYLVSVIVGPPDPGSGCRPQC